MPRRYDEGKLNMDILRETAEKCKNWGRWGPDDEIGTLNFISPENIVEAAQLIRKGKVFSLGLNFDNQGRIGHAMELRAFWTDFSYVKVDKVTVALTP